MNATVRLLKNILVLACGGVATLVLAHGDMHPRILEVTARIQQSPTNAHLYFQRAELYRIDGDFTNALADLNAVARLDRPASPHIEQHSAKATKPA